MDKNAIKKYAVWARRELIARVSQKALRYGITETETAPASADSVNGKLLSDAEKKQRQALIAKINEKGYEQVMEEVASTWFNRFSALRFMEVNNYLPSHVRVFTDEENNFKPRILTEAIHLDLDGLDLEKVYAYKEADRTEELYQYLLIVQCNALNTILPGMFQKISDYTELLLPDNLLREGSVIERMITTIPEDDWKDAVQIIGWLYQYYNSEKKDDVFAALKKNVKITKENIPAATQLFTPDWIVRYMVENSLGRLWLEGHPNDELKSEWKYYLDEAEQEADVQAQLDQIRKEYAAITPEQIKCIDPCCGSGHILAYLFDVLVRIYESYGFTTREAVARIVENNLYGLDIDDRAAQLASFAVMMKARQYDRRFFSRGIRPHVYSIAESNHADSVTLDSFCNGDATLTAAMKTIIEELHDAKEYGSILNVTPQDWPALYARFDEIREEVSLSREPALKELLPLVQVAEALSQKYDVVVTNPPYMGASGMSAKLTDFVKKNYPDSKSDLFAVFIEKCGLMTKTHGYQAMITQHSWMFLSSFEKLRVKLLQIDTVNMAHLGARAFEEIGGEVVQTTSFVMRKSHIANYKGVYCRLIDPTSQQGKEDMFLAGENRYESLQDNFSKIPGSPVAYWVGEKVFTLFERDSMSKCGKACVGMRTGNNDVFMRYWHEVGLNKFVMDSTSADDAIKKKAKWIPYNKGGECRKWYGNQEFVVNWEDDGYEIKENTRLVYPQLGDNLGWKISNENLYFQPHICWTNLTTKGLAFRCFSKGFIFDCSANVYFSKNPLADLGYLNSKVVDYLGKLLNPTLHFNINNFNGLPEAAFGNMVEMVSGISQNCVQISKADWDSFETSWDFQRHPLICGSSVAEAYSAWERQCDERFNQLKANEEELNRIFIDIYGLQDELTPDVEDADVTVRKADLRRDIKSFISYAVGCMFGRYSLDADGLVYAGGEWDASRYTAFKPDKDNIIPICDDEYFKDDVVGRFVKFVEVVYGTETLDENLKFIADALGGKGQPKDVIRNYFLNDFYSDHCTMYQKRPIYWLFDSGKKNGFKCLIYMHRYQPDTIARIRTDYAHEQQARYRTAIADLERRIASASTSERVKLNKKLTTLRAQEEELRAYEEKIHHLADQMISIDLDDGVKVNYAKFQDVLAKIK